MENTVVVVCNGDGVVWSCLALLSWRRSVDLVAVLRANFSHNLSSKRTGHLQHIQTIGGAGPGRMKIRRMRWFHNPHALSMFVKN